MVYEEVVASSVTATNWQPLTTVHERVDLGATERITVRDSLPGSGVHRFYLLRVRLN